MSAYSKTRLGIYPVLFALIALALSACSQSPYPAHEWLEAPGWSRARLLSNTESASPVLPVISEEGVRYFAVTSDLNSEPQIEVFALDAKLDPLWQRQLSLAESSSADELSLLLTTRGLEAYWISDGALFGAIFDRDGNIIEQAFQISLSERVVHYSVAVSTVGDRILWFSGSREEPGIYQVSSNGDSELIIPLGYRPQLKLDDSGALHALWVQNNAGETQYQFHYGYYPDAVFDFNRGQFIHSIVLAITSGLFGPELGLNHSKAYILWTELIRTGLEAGQISAFFVSFPIGKDVDIGSVDITSNPLLFPNGYKLIYSEAGSPTSVQLQAGPRAYPDRQEVPIAPTRILDIYPNPQQSGELVLAFRARLPYLRNREANQAGLIFLNDEALSSFQLLSFSPSISELPAVLSDHDNYLHLTWLEETDSGDYRLYYATTEPIAKSELDVLTNSDRILILEKTLFGLVSGALLIPFPLFWVLGPVLLTFFTGFMRGDQEAFTAPGTLFTIVAGLGIYYSTKLLTLPGMATYIPFSAWIPDLKANWSDILRLGLPMAIGLIGFIVAFRRTFYRQNNSPLFFFLIYAIVDGIATMAVYGVIFYGEI